MANRNRYSKGNQNTQGESFAQTRGRMDRDYDRDNQGSRSGRERDYDRHMVGRDFETNEPIFLNYGQMDNDRAYQQQYDELSRQGNREYRGYAEPDRDFSERGGYRGVSYGGRYGWNDWAEGAERGRNWRDRSRSSQAMSSRTGYDTGRDFSRDYSERTPFDESIAGRPYYGERGYREREGEGLGWRSTGMRREWEGNEHSRREARPDWAHNGPREYYSERNAEGHDEGFMDKVKGFFGVGPKGYKRSDDRIREDASEALADDPRIDASNIDVQVNDGEVTLTGSVPDRRTKRLAEDVIENLRGVKDVHNQLRVAVNLGEDVGSKPVTGTAKERTGNKAA